MKDRLYHPKQFLKEMLGNWEVGSIQSQQTKQLLSYVEKKDLASVKTFCEIYSEQRESSGSAFHSVLCFAEDFIARYEGRPRALEMLAKWQGARQVVAGEPSEDFVLLQRVDGQSANAILVSFGSFVFTWLDL